MYMTYSYTCSVPICTVPGTLISKVLVSHFIDLTLALLNPADSRLLQGLGAQSLSCFGMRAAELCIPRPHIDGALAPIESNVDATNPDRFSHPVGAYDRRARLPNKAFQEWLLLRIRGLECINTTYIYIYKCAYVIFTRSRPPQYTIRRPRDEPWSARAHFVSNHKDG